MLIELAQYIEPVGQPRPGDYRASDQDIVAVGFAAPTLEQYQEICGRCRSLGFRFSRETVQTPERRAVYMKDPLGFPIELSWLPQEFEGGSRLQSGSDRPAVADRAVISEVVIDAPYDRVWAALNDHTRMHRWIEADSFEVTRQGTPDSAGYGAERLLVTLGREVLQQIVRVVPGRIGYRAIAGTPFSYHNGTVELQHEARGTRVVWTIRFRTAQPGLGAFVQAQLEEGIPHQLALLKRMVEEEASG